MTKNFYLLFAVVALLLFVTKIAAFATSFKEHRHGHDDEHDEKAFPLARQAANNSGNKTSSSVVHELVDHLFSCYHRTIGAELPVIIHIEVLLIKVRGAIEREGILETVVAIFIKWHDKRLQWNPVDFGNIPALSLDAEAVIGLPDIVLSNSADNLYDITRNSQFLVRVSSDGYLKYVPTGIARTFCDLKLSDFPFDVQMCSLEFESWSLNNQSLIFDQRTYLRFDSSFTSQTWTICNLSTRTYNHKYFTGEIFSRVRYDITILRKSTFFVINLIFPCATLSMIQLLVFLLSSLDTTADRIGFGTTNLLTLVVFQTIVTEELPKTSDGVSALSKYIIALIITSAIGIFESVIVERMLTIRRRPPPLILYRFFKFLPLLWRELPVNDRTPSDIDRMPATMKQRIDDTRMTDLFYKNGSHLSLLERVNSNHFDHYYTSAASINLESPTLSVASCNSPTIAQYSRMRMKKFPRQKSVFRHPRGGNNNENGKRFTRNAGVEGEEEEEEDVTTVHCRKGNRDMWMELAYRVDSAAFLLCLFLSMVVPVALFAPPIFLIKNRCPTNLDHEK